MCGPNSLLSLIGNNGPHTITPHHKSRFCSRWRLGNLCWMIRAGSHVTSNSGSPFHLTRTSVSTLDCLTFTTSFGSMI